MKRFSHPRGSKRSETVAQSPRRGKFLRALTLWSIGLSLLLNTSCTTSEVASAESNTPSAAQTGPGADSLSPLPGWIKVSDDPLTFFPKGLPHDAETSLAHGDWVEAGPQNARWFVPKEGFGGKTEQELFGEAFSMRTKSQNKEIKQETRRAERRGYARSGQGLDAVDYLGLELMRLHSYSDNFGQQMDQAWLDAN